MSADPRLDAFFSDQADGLCHTDYWQTVAELWRSGDGAARGDERWRGIWDQADLAPGSELGLMTDEERAALAELPDPAELRVWRTGASEAATERVAREDVVALFATGDGFEAVVLAPR